MRCALTITSVDVVMAAPDISAHDHSSKSLKIAPSPFEVWAAREGYDTAPAVSPCPLRQYADPQTQAAFNAWTAGGRKVARMVTTTTLDTEALREKLLAIAGEP